MARKTLIGIFYNEEWLLPFWLKHHKNIFDHGILFDYHSTDRSVEICREICPTWEVRTSRNGDFAPHGVDNEISDVEHGLEGWRLALNITEFLVGNYDRMDDRTDHTRIWLGQYMITDMERREEPCYLNSDVPLWHQRWYGYPPVTDFSKGDQSHGSVPRAARSLHNHPAGYPIVGRHFVEGRNTYDDLTLFYYGYGSIEEASIQRKMQIQTQCPNQAAGSNHKFTREVLMDRYRKEQQRMSYNIREEIKPFVDAHNLWLAKKQINAEQQTHEHIRAAIATLNTALDQKAVQAPPKVVE